jgi:DNA-binding response OmpR family regulator
MNSPASLSLLIVDDNAHIRRIISAWCATMRFDAKGARDGREAVDLLLTRHFDVVLTDFHMPGMNGWALLHWMRKHRSGVPVCMMSFDADDSRFCAEVRPFVDGLLAKPFSIAALEQCVKNARFSRSDIVGKSETVENFGDGGCASPPGRCV